MKKVDVYNVDTIEDFLNLVKPLDVIVFDNKIGSNKNNKNSGVGEIFSKIKDNFTTWFIKFGSNSGWNHAGLILSSIPGKTRSNEFSEDELYLYEYQNFKQPATYQRLRDKLADESFNSIAIVRFNDLYSQDNTHTLVKLKTQANYGEEDPQQLAILDFKCRAGMSLYDFKNIKGNEKKPNEKHRYDILTIFHRVVDSLTIAFIIPYIIFSIVNVLLFFCGLYYTIFATCFNYLTVMYLFISTIYLVMKVKYRTSGQKNLDKNGICSTYPLHVIRKILSTFYDENEIEIFNQTWFEGTPPSPKNIYKNALNKERYTLKTYVIGIPPKK